MNQFQKRASTALPVNGVVRQCRFLVSLLALWLVSACVSPSAPVATELPTPVPDAVSILEPIARPAPTAGGNGAIYFTATNGHRVPVQLVTATSSAAAAAGFHETVTDNGVMRMVHLPDGLTIPPNGRVELRPGGKHLMLIDLYAALAVGESIEVTLYLEDEVTGAETLTLTVPVQEPGGPEHDH